MQPAVLISTDNPGYMRHVEIQQNEENEVDELKSICGYAVQLDYPSS